PSGSPCAGIVYDNTTYFSGSGTATDIPPRACLCDVAMGVYCDSTSGGCIAIGQIGDTCSGGGSYVCVKAAYCDSTTRTCVARKVVGDSCSAFSDECSAGNYCDEVSMKCAVALAEGAACTSSRACASGSCVNGKCGKGSSD